MGMSGCFGAVVWAPRGLDGEITPPRYGSVIMRNTNVAVVGICGYIASLYPNMILEKNRVFSHLPELTQTS